MTAIVGVFCRDGVVIGTDSAATLSTGRSHTIEQPTEKLSILSDAVILAGTGSVGLNQRFRLILENHWNAKQFTVNPVSVASSLAEKAIGDLQKTGAKLGGYGALVAYPCNKVHHLCEFAVNDFQPECKTSNDWFCTMGSSQQITDPFLGFLRGAFWPEGGQPDVSDAVFCVNWALYQAIQLNTGGVQGPIRMAVMERARNGDLKARMLETGELDQHMENMNGALGCLRKYREEMRASQVVSSLPAPPK